MLIFCNIILIKMVKERESELRHFGSKALHSSCVKKMPANRQKEASEFDVLSDLKDLSNKADKLAEKHLSNDPGLSEWFEALRMHMLSIRDCKDVKDVQSVPSFKTFINMKGKHEKDLSPAAETALASNMTTSVTKIATPVRNVSKMMSPLSKVATPSVTDSQMVTPSTSLRKKANPFVLLHQLSNQDINRHSDDKKLKNSSKAPLVTPNLNRTFDKVNTTIVLHSGLASNSNSKLNAVSSSNNSVEKIRSGSRKKKENECSTSHGMLTRSGSKRKSSETKNKSVKKRKIDSQNIPSATLNKNSQLRHPLRDLKSSFLAAENKFKLSAVIKPPVLQKQSLVSKEQHYLEEIKKKDKKAEENMLRLKAERQQKAEQTKKNREEKRTKTLQKRLQMEKEKEEKREIEAKKSQVKVNKENPKKTTRTKELVEQHVKESKSSIILSKKQSASNVDALPKTPANRKSDDVESYDLTPVPDSSTYNFSDDEDEEKTAHKRIPLWAQGVHLKSALMQQYYYPVDTDLLFGSYIETPNLAEIFKINKKSYFKRTSSAVWNSPPSSTYRR